VNARDDYPRLAEIADPPRSDPGNPGPDEARRALDEIDQLRAEKIEARLAVMRDDWHEWHHRGDPLIVQMTGAVRTLSIVVDAMREAITRPEPPDDLAKAAGQ